MAVVIRPLTLEDATAHQTQIEALVNGIIGCDHPEGEVINGERLIRERYELSSAAWDGSHIVGVCMGCRYPVEVANAKVIEGDYLWTVDSYHLDHLAVEPEFQKQRIGHQLVRRFIESAISHARRAGASSVELSVETGAGTDFEYVRRFYEKMGFKSIGERDYKGERDVVMWQSR